MCSKVVLRLAGAILDAFCINMGLICRKTAQNEIFEKCAKIGSVFRIIPILIQYRRKLGNYMSSIRQIPTTKCSGWFLFWSGVGENWAMIFLVCAGFHLKSVQDDFYLVPVSAKTGPWFFRRAPDSTHKVFRMIPGLIRCTQRIGHDLSSVRRFHPQRTDHKRRFRAGSGQRLFGRIRLEPL